MGTKRDERFIKVKKRNPRLKKLINFLTFFKTGSV